MKKTLKKKRNNCLYILLFILYLVTKFYSKKKVGGGRTLESFPKEVRDIITELYKLLKIGEYSMTDCEKNHPELYVKHRTRENVISISEKKKYEIFGFTCKPVRKGCVRGA